MKPSRRRPDEVSRTLILILLGLGLFGAGVWVGARYVASPTAGPPAAQTPPPESQVVVTPEPPPPERFETEAPPPVEEYVPTVVGARIALVVDDLGRSLRDLESLDALGIPLTYSVLPFEIRTREVVSEINRRGWELVCHLPMEGQSGANPGPGALTSSMSRSELVDATRAALSAVPGAVGVNNHMGSILSADVEAMEPILDVMSEKGLFYVDSRTSADSVGYKVALERGVSATERQVFLDADHTTAAIEEQFDRLLWLAQDRGEAVAIGHPHAVTLEVLSRRIPEAVAAGYEFVPVSYLLDRVASPE